MGRIKTQGFKIPKGQSEAEIRRRTDNTMAKRKRTQGHTLVYKTLHRKLEIEQYVLHITRQLTQVIQEGKQAQ